MTLFNQFQTFIGSIILGMLFSFIWSLFNRVFYSKKLFIIRLIFVIALICSLTFTYYIFLSRFGHGIFNVFYVLALFLGLILYYEFYAYNFEVLFEKAASSLYKTIIYPIKLKKKKFRDKLKSRKKKHGKKSSIKKSQPHT